MLKILFNNSLKRIICFVLLIVLFAGALFTVGAVASYSTINATKRLATALSDSNTKSAAISISFAPKGSAPSSEFMPPEKKLALEEELQTKTLPLYNNELQNCNFMLLPGQNGENSAAFYCGELSAFTTLTNVPLQNYGLTVVAGRLPTNKDEIAIPHYLYLTYAKFGIPHSDNKTFKSPSDILGQTVSWWSYLKMKIVGVVDTGLDYNKYETLKTPLRDVAENALYSYKNLASYLTLETKNSLHTTIFVSDAFLSYQFAFSKYTVKSGFVDLYTTRTTARKLKDVSGVKLIAEKTVLSSDEIALSNYEIAKLKALRNIDGETENDFNIRYANNPSSDSDILEMLQNERLRIPVLLSNANGLQESKIYTIVGISPSDSAIFSDAAINEFYIAPETCIRAVAVGFENNPELYKKTADIIRQSKHFGHNKFLLHTAYTADYISMYDGAKEFSFIWLILGTPLFLLSCGLVFLFFWVSVKHSKKELNIPSSTASRNTLKVPYVLEALFLALVSSGMAVGLLALWHMFLDFNFGANVASLIKPHLLLVGSLTVVGIAVFVSLLSSIIAINAVYNPKYQKAATTLADMEVKEPVIGKYEK